MVRRVYGGVWRVEGRSCVRGVPHCRWNGEIVVGNSAVQVRRLLVMLHTIEWGVVVCRRVDGYSVVMAISS